RHRLGLGTVVRRDLAAANRTTRDDRILHAGKAHVDPELRAAVALRRRVEALRRLADQLPRVGRLQCRLVRHGQRRRRLDERAEARLAAALRVHDLAVLGFALAAVDAPGLRRGLDQHLARRRARLPQRLPGRADRRAAACALRVQYGIEVGRIGRRELEAD